ncbi:MAG: aminodeoxychorismate synthase component I [Planctomycetes bacterium]|nr:aminodeoxychorismate synthase component I [Planctomycetota bacterium]
MNGLPLVEELSSAIDVPGALQALRDWPRLLLLDSARTGIPTGRFSFLMADPFHWELLPQVDRGTSPNDGSVAGDPLARLQLLWSTLPADTVTGLPPFQGGAAGLLAYDLHRAWERISLPRCDEFALPALAVGLYDWVIAWDHAQGRAWIVSQGFPETDRDRRVDRAAQRMRQVQEALVAGGSRTGRASDGTNSRVAAAMDSALPRDQLAPEWEAPGLPGLLSNFSRDDYLRAVERAIDYIYAGDIFQVNLSQRLLYPLAGDPLELYLKLRRCNPAPFAGYFAVDDWVIASSSPERFLSVTAGEVETRPIKGTRRRRPGAEADLFTRDELRESAKDQAENVMIVDLLRNDLSRVCAAGSVRVPELCRVETYETVQHLVSEIRGRLEPGRSSWDLFRAAFPGGSITGAPKVRAMEIIAELEPTARGPYCGSLFYVGFDGQTDSNLLIRTFTVRKGWIQCPVGGGIVAQSSPAAEYEETLVKAEGMLRALRPGG